jgi:hypothetical protein
MTRRFFVMGFAVLAVLVAACGGGGSDTPAPASGAGAGERAPREDGSGTVAGESRAEPEVETAPAAADASQAEPVDGASAGPSNEQFLSGDGDGVAPFEAAGGLVLLDFGYIGSGQFMVRVRPAGSGGAGELVVDTPGPWAGTLPLRFDAGTFEMLVTTDDVWFASVREATAMLAGPGAYAVDPDFIGGWLMAAPELSEAADVDQSLFFSGTGTTVSPPFRLEGTLVAALLHRGPGVVTVWLVDADGQFGELFTDFAGQVETSRALEVPAGVYRVAVTSDGTWTVAVEPR